MPNTRRALLDRACAIMLEAHQDQADKSGAPYWRHPLAVAQAVFAKTSHVPMTVVALLHDVLEDSDWTAEGLREALSEVTDLGEAQVIVASVETLTKRRGESYESYLQRVQQDHWAAVVKRSDMQHNLSRAPNLGRHDATRLFAKYVTGLNILDGDGRG